MPRRTSFVTMVQRIVREQVGQAVQGLLGAVGGPGKKAKDGRRRRGRGLPPTTRKRRRGPGRPPKQEKGE